MNTEKTRVAILSSSGLVSEFFKFVVNSSGRPEDFEIISSANISDVAEFTPTILFIDVMYDSNDIQDVWKNITAGGIAIFPENLATEDSAPVSNYYRKIPFGRAEISANNGSVIWENEEMNVPLQFNSEELTANLNGLQQLAQTVAINSDDFMETAAGFSP